MFTPSRSLFVIAVTAWCISSATAAQSDDQRQSNRCFGPGDIVSAPFRVFRYPSRPPLTNEDPAYKYYPLTDSTGSQASIVNAGHATNIRRNYFMWANICDAAESNRCAQHPAGSQAYAFGNPPAMPQFSDPVSKEHILFKMTSYTRANTCTMAQAAYALGYDDAKVRSIVAGSGLTVIEDRTSLAKLHLDSDHMFRDVCVMPDARLSSAVKGLMLDYEVHDGRSPQIARDFLVAFAALVHGAGREAILYTNPLNAPGQRLSGLDGSNLNQIQSTFDMTTIFLLRKGPEEDFARDFSAQLNLLSGPLPARPPMINFDVGRSTLRDAEITRDLLLSHRLPAVVLLEKSTDLEGPCSTAVNRKIACLLQGRCAG